MSPNQSTDLQTDKATLSARSRILGLILICVFIFQYFPDLDLWVSNLFVNENRIFTYSKHPLPIAILDLFEFTVMLLAVLVLALAIRAGFFTKTNKVPHQVWGFVVWSYILCNGVLVNGFLKHFWGRARPVDVEQFGGTRHFTPPLVATSECSSNCSFVSATTTAAALMCVLLFALIAWRLTHKRRLVFISALIAIVVTIGLTRIAMGRHFLSDVVFAVLFSALVVNLLYAYMGIAKHRTALSWQNFRADIGGLLRVWSWRPNRAFFKAKP